MNLMSLNIRGVGNPHKLDWVNRLRREHKLTFCGIQETRVSIVSSTVIEQCWGSSDFDFEWVESYGFSGGLVSFWDINFFQKIASIKNRHFLAVVGYCNGIIGETIVVNVYAPQDLGEKKLMWDNLLNLISSRPGTWGDLR